MYVSTTSRLIVALFICVRVLDGCAIVRPYIIRINDTARESHLPLCRICHPILRNQAKRQRFIHSTSLRSAQTHSRTPLTQAGYEKVLVAA
jgi:hypothetical protein